MNTADQIVSGLLADPTTQSLLEGKSPEVVASVSDRWTAIVTDKLAELLPVSSTPVTPITSPTPIASMPAPDPSASSVSNAQ